jgi:K+-transporting ATPase ATPase A chain
MMTGRFALAIPALALAGRFASQLRRPLTLGTLPTDTLQFATLVVATGIVVVGLGFFPALSLGPIVEHLMMTR